MKLILFLGAGVSIPSGLPTADGLTNLLFTTPYHQAGHSKFVRGEKTLDASNQPNDLPRILELLRQLKQYDSEDIKRVGYSRSTGKSSGAIFRSATTYEDLFYLCEQMSYWSDGRIDNSLVTPFMEKIVCNTDALFTDGTLLSRISDLGMLAEKACHFIETVVAEALQTSAIKGFELIRELANLNHIEQLNIVTLNHDTLVEQYLSINDIKFIDGFGEPDGDIRWYKSELFDSTHTKVRLIKLHGSINWYSHVRDGKLRPICVPGIDVASLKDASGKTLTLDFWRPTILSGMNKAVAYQRGVFADMHYRFHQALRECETIVMSGYGWGDAAINWQLDTWLDQRDSNNLTLLHPRPTELSDRSIVMASGYDGWIKNGQLIVVGKWLCDTTLTDFHGFPAFG